MSVLIAIDPGKKGGICVIRNGELKVVKMPDTPRDICDLLEQAQLGSYGSSFDASAPAPPIRCYMERVGGYAGGEGAPGSAMFNFGCGYGVIIGILTALKVPLELVTPQQWQKGLGLGSKGLQRAVIHAGMTPEQKKTEKRRVGSINNKLNSEWKNKLKALAQQMFPNVKVTLGVSDCLLILEWARRRDRVPPPQWTESQAQLAIAGDAIK